jgi:ATP-dependent helicase/nuclease subunit B
MLERFAARLEHEPLLVVPTGADVERFEDELLARRPVALGGRVVTFRRLFEIAADAAGVVGSPALTPAQRQAVLAAVVDDGQLQALAEPARRPGFVDALDRFVAEVQAALVTAAELRARCAELDRRGHAAELASLYGAYVERRDALGRSDQHSLAAAAVKALREQAGAWGTRPILVHGFDDLTAAQLALLEGAALRADVLVSVLHEKGRACLAARGSLVAAVERVANTESGSKDSAADGQLSLALDAEMSAADPRAAGARVELSPAQGPGLLRHLERTFMTDSPARRKPAGEVQLLEAAGVRNEVEQVAAAVTRLLREGVPPSQIAVVARSMDASAALAEEVFDAFGVPVASQGERPLTETAAGRGLIALIRAALTTRTAADLMGFLRCPARASRARVDRLERAIRVDRLETVEQAAEAWYGLGGRDLWELESLQRVAAEGAPALLERVSDLGRDLAERPGRRLAPVLPVEERADLLAIEAAAAALDDMAELSAIDARLAPDPERLVRLLESLRVPRTRQVAGRVEVVTPYGARARQFPYVFVLSLQEGEFPRLRREDPFLSAGERRTVGLPERADQRDEERYLFYVSITRATRVLHLSYRSADDEGTAATRSFFIDEVLDLLAPGAEDGLTQRRGLSATVFEPAAAPTERELARSLAERRLSEPPAALVASAQLSARLAAALRRAGDRAARLPGSLTVPYVVEQFAEKDLIGASSLELNAECSFRYFVDHELRPRELAPRPEPLTRGGITHVVLERLYEELGERPTPETLDAAVARASEILAAEARDSSLDPANPKVRPVYRRMESDIARFLRYDAENGAGEVLAVEASFGDGEDDDRPPLPLQGFGLHGKVDRVDGVGGGQALIRDYKTGATVASRKEIAERKRLQLPLYMLAVRELWGVEPIGGAYHPLGRQYEAMPRGLLRGPAEAWPLRERFRRTDFTADEDEFERALDAAREEAERLAARIHAGHLDRDPLGGSCPAHCDFHPICRRERGEKNPVEGNGQREENGDE